MIVKKEAFKFAFISDGRTLKTLGISKQRLTTTYPTYDNPKSLKQIVNPFTGLKYS